MENVRPVVSNADRPSVISVAEAEAELVRDCERTRDCRRDTRCTRWSHCRASPSTFGLLSFSFHVEKIVRHHQCLSLTLRVGRWEMYKRWCERHPMYLLEAS